MAGQHQIWKHNTLDRTTTAFSGDGYERNLNGSSSGSTSFAQPSGISLAPDSKEAYIADSENSSIRALDLRTGASRLLVGGDPMFSDNLFKLSEPSGLVEAGNEPENAISINPWMGISTGKDLPLYSSKDAPLYLPKLKFTARFTTARKMKFVCTNH